MNITELIRQINYSDISEEEIFEEISKIDNSEDLHRILLDYNWDDGFEIPQRITDNKNCELSTALFAFELAEGLTYLQEKSESAYNSYKKDWFDFVSSLYSRILNGEFQKGNIKFKPDLTKVQIYKLKKFLDDKDFIFIEETGSK